MFFSPALKGVTSENQQPFRVMGKADSQHIDMPLINKKIILKFKTVSYLIAVLLLLSALFIFSSCRSPEKKYALKAAEAKSETLILPIEDMSQVELEMIRMGLVDIQSLDTTIRTDIKYSGTDNFMKSDIYGDYNKAYLQPDVAEKLVNAQFFLKELHPGYRLLVFDAARTVSAQKMLWDALKMPAREKGKFACNPRKGSVHNFGAAVDLSIIDDKGNELDMGCPYDFFGPLAYPGMENQLLSDSTLTKQQVDNRKLLRQVMSKAGFFNIQTEWWHFNSCTRAEAIGKYEKIE